MAHSCFILSEELALGVWGVQHSKLTIDGAENRELLTVALVQEVIVFHGEDQGSAIAIFFDPRHLWRYKFKKNLAFAQINILGEADVVFQAKFLLL